MTKWIYRYIRADREEIDMGPYATRGEAQAASDRHASFGATTGDAIEVPDNYVLFNGREDD